MFLQMQSSSDMLRLDLFDPETLINLCVNPNEINPQQQPNQSQTHFTEELPGDSQIQLNAVIHPATAYKDSISVMRRSDDDTGGVFYGPNAPKLPNTPKLKLEMEIFGDLTTYCHEQANMPSQNAVDELNTPVFEIKAPFDFDRQQIGVQEIVTHSNYPINKKIKVEQSENHSVNIDNTANVNGDRLVYNKDVGKFITSDKHNTSRSENDYTVSNGVSSSIIYSSILENDHMYYNNNSNTKITPMFEDEDETFIIINSRDAFPNSSNSSYIGDDFKFHNETSNSQYTNISSNQYADLTNAHFETPDTSRSGSDVSGHNSPIPKLQMGSIFKNDNIINTPEIIQNIDAMESEKFGDLLSFIDSEFQNAAADSETSLLGPAESHPIKKPISTSFNTKSAFIGKCPRTRKTKDDDEDYVPPTKKKQIGRKTIKLQAKAAPHDYESDSSSDDCPVIRRGRPRKRNISVSSDEFKGADGTKYREMRDKNNEASRKSRLKRKMKELELDKEADQLEERNLKLKAQVQELEKSVANFRNNLMKILLKK